MAPKSMALRRAEVLALWTALPLYAFYWSMWPAIWVLNRSANWILRAVGLSSAHSLDSTYTTDEIKLILRSSSGPGPLVAGRAAHPGPRARLRRRSRSSS